MSFYQRHVPLSDDSIRRRAPSVFAEKPSPNVSERYAFIPTTQVLALLREAGWVPVFTAQSKARVEGGGDFIRHMLRFQAADARKDMKVGDSVFEIGVSNSHNGTSQYSFFAGLYRLICSNGLTVADSVCERFKIRHQGFNADQVAAALAVILERLPKVTEHLEAMRATKLDEKQKLVFAEDAKILRWSEKAPVEASALLVPRRAEDKGNDLWTVMNVVQENICIGGLNGVSGGGRRRKMTTREIGSVQGNLRVNRDLWQLAEATVKKLA